MKCPKCNSKQRKINVNIYGIKNKVLSFQCSRCDYFEFEKTSSKKIIEELKKPTSKTRFS